MVRRGKGVDRAQVHLRLSKELLSRIDAALTRCPAYITRTDWIIDAIQAKLAVAPDIFNYLK